jgi:hypothetical protein
MRRKFVLVLYREHFVFAKREDFSSEEVENRQLKEAKFRNQTTEPILESAEAARLRMHHPNQHFIPRERFRRDCPPARANGG